MAEKIIKPITKSFEAIVERVAKYAPGKKRKPRKKAPK
jgi:hypothetical protein